LRGVSSDAQVALVTGAAVRLGRAIASGLAAAGYRVWIHHHTSHTAARELVDELSVAHPGAALGPIAADLTDADARAALVQRVLDPGGPSDGRLHLLVNSAASFERGAFVDRSDDDLLRVLALNLVAPLSLTRAFASALAAHGGSIVNLVDLGAFDPWPGHLDHCVAKSGLRAATRALAAELAPVRVNALAPGPVLAHDDLDDQARAALRARVPRGELGEPGDVVDAVTFLARARHISGQTLAIDGGQQAAVAGPRPVRDPDPADRA
jgi:pteridine reductase